MVSSVYSDSTGSGVFRVEAGERTEGQPPSRFTSRTPSPTPSESDALQRRGLINLKRALKNREKGIISMYCAAGVFFVLSILLVVFRVKIRNSLLSVALRIQDLPAGWLVSIVILIVLSFPPLFGLEVIIVLCGFVWGLWIGFGIVVAGTVLGELANYLTFRLIASARTKRCAGGKTKIDYACLSRVFQEGGVVVALVARNSLFPPNYATAVFATCGMRFWVIAVAVLASLSPRFVMVYLGALYESEFEIIRLNSAASIITYVTLAVKLAVACKGIHYILELANAVKPRVFYERRKAREGNARTESVDLKERIGDARPELTAKVLEGENRKAEEEQVV